MQGWQKTSFIDYPGKIASVFFYGGCNFRCEFCHNGDLVLGKGEQQEIEESAVIQKIRNKKHLYEAVVITGGEPTLFTDLDKIIRLIKKETGLPVKLDTNGTSPEKIEQLISEKLVDYIAMDIKNDFNNYETIVNVKINVSKIQESIKVIMNSGIDYEFRTTAAPGVTKEDILNISEYIKGAKKYYLQVFQELDVIDNSCKKEKRLSEDELKEIATEIKNNFSDCNVR